MEILRYTAFSDDPAGGNPAGVVLDATGADDAEMQRTAAQVGYSETAFLTPAAGGAVDVRYFSPLAEVPFCGHATIASAVAWAERHGTGELSYRTRAGLVRVRTTRDPAGPIVATLVSVTPRTAAISREDLDELLATLDLTRRDLDPAFPVRAAYAGAWHPVLALASRERLSRLDYDLGRLGSLMAARDWTTIALVHREATGIWHARNPFPPGGVVEDPATGAAAAALGGYLREIGAVSPASTLTVHQGVDMGRPSLLTVDIPVEGGIAVTGTAVPLGVPA